MSLTTDQQNRLEKPVTATAYFAEFQFVSGTLRLSNLNVTVNWGGYDWSGMGALGNISPVNESDGVESSALNFTLNVAQSSVLALGVGPVEDYRGHAAKLYMCPLNENMQLVDTPVICWRGVMDMMSVGVEGDGGSIVLKCETSSYALKRRPTMRMNAAQHKKKYPTDTGFDYLVDLISRPQTWLSKRFQTIE